MLSLYGRILYNRKLISIYREENIIINHRWDKMSPCQDRTSLDHCICDSHPNTGKDDSSSERSVFSFAELAWLFWGRSQTIFETIFRLLRYQNAFLRQFCLRPPACILYSKCGFEFGHKSCRQNRVARSAGRSRMEIAFLASFACILALERRSFFSSDRISCIVHTTSQGEIGFFIWHLR